MSVIARNWSRFWINKSLKSLRGTFIFVAFVDISRRRISLQGWRGSDQLRWWCLFYPSQAGLYLSHPSSSSYLWATIQFESRIYLRTTASFVLQDTCSSREEKSITSISVLAIISRHEDICPSNSLDASLCLSVVLFRHFSFFRVSCVVDRPNCFLIC